MTADFTSTGWRSIGSSELRLYATALDASAVREATSFHTAIEAMDVRPGQRAIEIGCGLGHGAMSSSGSASPLTWGAKVIEIDQIGVASDQRRRGVGTALLQAVRQLAEESGTDRLHLTVWGFNEAAQRFFASQGFKQAMLRMTDP